MINTRAFVARSRARALDLSVRIVEDSGAVILATAISRALRIPGKRETRRAAAAVTTTTTTTSKTTTLRLYRVPDL